MEGLGFIEANEIPFALRWDKREDFGVQDEIDCGVIAEDNTGIRCKMNPHALLLQDPELWDIVSEWVTCTKREINRGAKISNWYATAWFAMLGAYEREKLRRMGAQRPLSGAMGA